MSSRPNSGSTSQRFRYSLDEYPPLPTNSTSASTASLRNLTSTRERSIGGSVLPPSTSTRPQSRHWSAAARRAERIRNIENRHPSSRDSSDRASMDPAWRSLSRRIVRMRHATEPRNLLNFDELDEETSQLSALLDITSNTYLTSPMIPPCPPSLPPSLRPHDFTDDNRRNKRRKLDADRLGTATKTFRYGKYGQVEPGELRMEIVSCDGGIYDSPQQQHVVENILKDDNSVYCTKGSRCNIVLRHQGGSVFTIKELIIKAPGSKDFSDPIREGMVFIAMNQDDMLSRTAQYQIQYAHKTRNRSYHREAGNNLIMVAGEPHHTISIQHHDDGTTSARSRRAYLYQTEDSEERSRVPQMPEEFNTNLPDFHVTTECSDEEEDLGRQYAGAPNIGPLPFENEDSDSDDFPDSFNSEDPTDSFLHHSRRQIIQRERARDRERERHRNRTRDGDHAANMSLTEAFYAHANATQEAIRAVGGGELLTPHARFYIEKKKSKCTIRFDPPVSGRFILLKMWSSHAKIDSNIDIQSIKAKGFSGPRFFPAVELR